MAKKYFCLIFCLVFLAAGCASLGHQERSTLRELKSVGISPTEQTIKNPYLAGGLNLFPGFGNFYLGIGADEPVQILYGVLNFIFWPPSILWGVPQATIDAVTLNKRETAFYYQFNPQGISKLDALKKAHGQK